MGVEPRLFDQDRRNARAILYIATAQIVHDVQVKGKSAKHNGNLGKGEAHIVCFYSYKIFPGRTDFDIDRCEFERKIF